MISLPLRRPTIKPTRGKAQEERGLGTFSGVFTPSLVTILGVLMYLRSGWMVGNVGLTASLGIVTLATLITYLTALSIAAIATDQPVKTGGAYYMISRSLGIEVGGAVGIPLYLAQALSVALYTVGFAESLVGVFPVLDPRSVGVVATLFVAVLALTSARAAIRAQYIVMILIALSLFSLAFGSPLPDAPVEMWDAPDRPRESFWVVFAVFFPAVTGIMAGVNMSGDLKDPAKSIPKGTLAAIGAGWFIYMTLPIILASRADPVTLIEDPLVMRRISLWGDAILLGLWGAALSSAVGSILGAPRVLQALARDGILPRPFRYLGRGSGPDDEPRAATALTLALALVAVYFGNLNVIAPILTMFFLTTYGVLNVAAGLERFIGNPSFRPVFKTHWSLSLYGAIGCIIVMLLINAWGTLIAGMFVTGVFIWLERRDIKATWGDVRRGIWMAVARAGLLRIGAPTDQPSPKNWRPHMLVFSGAPKRRWHLIDLANAITHNKALMTVATVVPVDSTPADRRRAISINIHEYLARNGVQALVRVIPAPDYFEGAERLVEAYGLGPLVPNTVMIGDISDPVQRHRYCEMIAHFHEARRNVVIVRDPENRGFGMYRRIDVWWGGLKRNGGLMVILAYLLQTSLAWRGADVRLKMVVPTDAAAHGARKNLETITRRIRTGATAEVLVGNGRPFEEILRESSRDADLVMLGIKEPGDDFLEHYTSLIGKTIGLPPTALVLAAEEIVFGEMLQ